MLYILIRQAFQDLHELGGGGGGLVTKLCLTCDCMDCSLPGSSDHGILQAEYWNWLPFFTSGDLPNPGIEPRSPVLRQILYGLSQQKSPRQHIYCLVSVSNQPVSVFWLVRLIHLL